jgi:anti-anti-sigma factor
MSHFRLERKGPKVRVHWGKELPVSFVPELRELFCAIHDDGVLDLVLDCSKTTSLDAAGLHFLLAARNSYSQDGRTFKLALLQPLILSLLETLRLDQPLNARAV